MLKTKPGSSAPAADVIPEDPVTKDPTTVDPVMENPEMKNPVVTDVTAEAADMTTMDIDPSIQKPASPLKNLAKDMDDDVVFVSEQQTLQPSTSSVLAKITDDVKPAMRQHDKDPATQIKPRNYEEMSLAELQQEYDSRVAQHRKSEEEIIDAMKKQHEV